jgi:hypothetical protein
MKKWAVFFLFSGVLSVFTACKPDAPLQYNSPDGVYFSASSDSVFYTFAKYPTRVVDTIMIPVSLMGKPSDAARQLSVVATADSGSQAVEGTHYKLLQPYAIPAKGVTTLMPVVVYRTGNLDSVTNSFILQLKANDKLGLAIDAKTSVKVKVAYLQMPPTWGTPAGTQWAGYSANFGTWTKTKYKLILDALYSSAADTTISEFPYTRFSYPTSYPQYLQIVRNYIRIKYPGNYSTPLGVGATLRDPDVLNNPVVQVGPANY